MTMKKPRTATRSKLKFDCPWRGHVADPSFELRNSAAPQILGLRCVKCGCLVYTRIEVSPVVGPAGEQLASSPQADGDGGEEGV